ncbi:MAG: hypothetical protein HOP17_05985 [Acidobacteria bacterium]|nr:hypothetical protein [Acidobacteriota bacterium]
MKILKGILAILVGFIFIGVTHNGTDFILESLGIFTPPLTVRFDTTWMVITAIIYRNLFMIAAGYLTAMLAPAPKMRYVVILGVIGTLFGIGGVFVNMKYDLAPMWYPVLLVLLGFPSLYLGAKLKTG